MLKRVLKRLGKSQTTPQTIKPTIIPRSQHTISRQAISQNALKVLYRLNSSGYSAYLVGGCVRDLLLGYKPKDFDIATNAHPEEIRRLFKNCRLIGKRFRLAHIIFGKEIIEVATFRTHHENAQEHMAKIHQGMIVRDNVYGTIEDDVWRRDFSINALYYNIADFSVVDYTGGMHDIQNKLLRIIGNPEQRFHEDPVRLLRAVRFIGKLNIAISPETETHLQQLHHLLQKVSSARLFQEVLKLFQEGATESTFKLLQKYHLFNQLFSQTAHCLTEPETQQLISKALINTDKRYNERKTISPAFLFTVFLWRPIVHNVQKQLSKGMPTYVALENAIQTVFKLQTQQLAIPRNLLTSVREICLLQHFFTRQSGSRPFRLLDNHRFRAGFDLLALRAEIKEVDQELVTWWENFYKATHEERQELLKTAEKATPKKRKPSYRRKSKKQPSV